MSQVTTLIIMAAGLGSRYGGGGLKQLAHIDKAGNIIMDYSVYDAVEAGFGHIVFVIRRDTFAVFKEVIGDRIEETLKKKGVKVSYVFQELGDLPEGISLPEDRTSPWGTGHAVLAARPVVDGPFVIINADDYYGKEGYVKLHDWLVAHDGKPEDKFRMAMAGFVLKNTVSEHGTVTRGICMAGADGHLKNIIETKGIRMENEAALCDTEAAKDMITPDSIVSMNMWAAYPEFLDFLAEDFKAFLTDGAGDLLTKEYLVPVIVGDLLKSDRATVEVLDTRDKWIGITYQDDLPGAQAAFEQMIADGKYPRVLWE